MKDDKVLLYGFPKTGNTWVRLFLANYFNILNFGAKKSLEKKAAIEIFKHNINKEIKEKTPLKFKEGFPKVYHTHNSRLKTPEKTEFFNRFNKFVYIYRNPYDLIISFFYHAIVSKNKSLFISIEKNGLKKTREFLTFVKKKLPLYIRHVYENKNDANLVLNYDDLREDPNNFKPFIKLFVEEIDEEIFQKTIEISSFENTRKKLLITKRKQIEDGSLIFLKTRDGRSGQYLEVMKPKIIVYIKHQWKIAGLSKKLEIFNKINIIDEGRKNKVLLCGFQKTGNTWVRFLIYNYFYVLNFSSKKTLTYEELRTVDRNNPFSYKKRKNIRMKDPFIFENGFPKIGYTHASYDGVGLTGKINFIKEYWNFFDKIVYIYRNPFDVIISNFYFWINRKKPSFIIYLESDGFKGWVNFILRKYIHHVKTTINKADIILSYDKMRRDPNEIKKILNLFTDNINELALKKTIELSSFENIKKMGIETNQKYGMGRKYRGNFTRDGRSGQYKEIFKDDLIEYIKIKWKEAGLEL